MTKKPIAGVFPALTTPFEKGALSVSRLKSNIEKYNRYDLTGYLVLGSTGESVLMDERESLEAIETVKSSAPKGKTLLVGTGMFSAPATVKFTNMAADAGADYGLVVTPYYYKAQMSGKVMEAFFREVADHVKIPILIYNVPKFTGLDMPLETILTLAEHPNIAGIKESSGNLSFVEEIARGCPREFTLLQGNGSVLFPALMVGAKGGILAVADMTPGEAVEIFRKVQAGEYQKARDLQLRILPAAQKIVGGMGVPGIKCAMDMLGFFGGELRSPLKPVSEEQKKTVAKILKDADLLS
jgi:4-hydroxy-2-oxoglutarate aldolase